MKIYGSTELANICARLSAESSYYAGAAQLCLGGCKGRPVTSKGCEFSIQDPGAHMTNGDKKYVAVRSITGNFNNLLFRSFKRLF
jgi:hypothetical protein